MSMSRVSSMDGREMGSERTRSSISHRKMSFNPIDDWPPQADRKASVVSMYTKEEVSKGKRIIQVAVAVVYCLFAAGIVFGYAAIKPVLIQEGVYKNQCTKQELRDGIQPCYGQEIRLNLMFTIAAVSTNVAALPIGAILDRYGPRVCGIIGSVFLAIGAALFALAGSFPFDGFIPGYFFLALGGPFVFISSFQLSNCFPAQSGLILALLTGAFDSSSALFLLFRILYDATGGQLNTHNLFLIYLIVPVFILVVQIFIMPAESYKTVGEIVRLAEDEINAPTPIEDSISDEAERLRRREEFRARRESVMTEIDVLLKTSTNDKRAKREDAKNQKSGVWGALHGYSALEQIKTPWFWLITLFTVVQMLRINYFVATIRPQYQYLLHSKKSAEMVNHIFDVALPLGGVLSVPFIGSILDRTSTPFSLAFLVVAATVIGVLGCLPHMWAGIANVGIFVVYRPFYYTTVSDYSAKVFGFQTFGKVYGLIICLAGLFNFLESPLDAATHTVFKNDPVPVNVALTSVALVVGIALVIYVYWRSRTMKRDLLEEEADGARESLMPTANGNSYGT